MSIIGKFLKIAGKDPNGNAKGVAVTENGEVKVQQTGSIVSVETVANAISIPAETSEEIDLGITGEEKEVLLSISIDQQPWSLDVGDATQTTGIGGNQKKTTYYPRADGVTNTYSIYVPYVVYLLGIIHYQGGLVTDDYPSSFIEAKQVAIPPRAGITCRIRNQSLNTATVTIKTIKVMR